MLTFSRSGKYRVGQITFMLSLEIVGEGMTTSNKKNRLLTISGDDLITRKAQVAEQLVVVCLAVS